MAASEGNGIDQVTTEENLQVTGGNTAIKQQQPDPDVGSGTSATGDCLVKCANCDQIFSPESFEEHVCEYDEQKKRIEPAAAAPGAVLDGHPCFRQLKENIAQWRKLLKRKGKLGGADGEKKKKSTRRDDLKEEHKCLYCFQKYVHPSGLKKHMVSRHPDKPMQVVEKKPAEPVKVCLKCQPCGMIFASVDKMLQHLEKVDWEDELERTEGIYMSEGKIWLRKATRIVVLTTVYQCEFCDKHFSDMPALFRHESLHDPMFGYECSMCEIKTSVLKDMLFHRLNECVFRQEWSEQFSGLPCFFVCNVCEQQFENLLALSEHRYENFHLFPRFSGLDDDQETSKTLRMGCDSCAITFDNADLHISHHAQVHESKRSSTLGSRLATPRSSPSTATPNTSATPENTSAFNYSSTTRPYLCEVCGKTYTQSSHLWQHLRFHNGVRPFVCPEEGCKRSFTIRPDLKDHIRKCHTGERPYHCTQCDKRFLTGSVYYQHRLIHRGERRYACDECDKRFYRADALKNHQRIHSGEKPYPCTHCEKQFRQRGDREKHIRVRHLQKGDGSWSTPKSSRAGRKRNNGGQGSSSRRGRKTKRSQKKVGGENVCPVEEPQQEEHSEMEVGSDLSLPLPESLFLPILNDMDML